MNSTKLGQNFLVNTNVAEKIARRFLPVDGEILEIGPGKGILTQLLLKYRQGNPFTAVELDNILFYQLKNKHAQTEQFTIVNRDILKVDLFRLFPGQSVNIVGNVPYYISKELMDWVIAHHKAIRKGMFMMQKEFVDKVNTEVQVQRQTSPQSLILNYLFRLEKQFDVQPGSFSPRPRVKSSVFSFERKDDNEIDADIDVQSLYTFLKNCFRNRRKTLMNNISNAGNTEKLWEHFEEHGLNPNVRAEQLSIHHLLPIFTLLSNPK